MQDIQDLVIQNYNDNMSYFQEKFPAIHNKLLALETLLDEGTFPQKYDLEYKDGYFDVVELQTDALLYNQDSNKFSQKITDEISYKKNEHTFKSYRKINYNKQAIDVLKSKDAYTQFSTSAEILEYYNSLTDDTMHLTQIEKFIFLGVGLGIHIPLIVAKFDLQIILIIEENIELFRLSLFVTNYKETFKNSTPFFSIAENQTEFSRSFNTFFQKAFFKNQYIKFNLFSSIYEDKIEEIRTLLITRPEAVYAHNRLLIKSKKVMNRITKSFKFLNLEKKENETFFEKKPWLVLGAGPSLHNNIEWLTKNQNKFIIIAAFTTLSTLKKFNIKPDIITQIDENDITSSQMIENLGDLSFLENSLVFLSASVSQLLFDTFEKDRIYLHEDRTKYKLDSSTLPVGSVGETIYTLPLLYNVLEIYLLGIDLALSRDGLTHAPDHFKVKTLTVESDEDKNTENVKDFQLSNNTINVKGNFQALVKTTPILAFSIPIINMKTEQYKDDKQTIYNLSDGAFFENTIPTRVETLSPMNSFHKQDMFQELQTFFDKYSTSTLSDKEKDGIKCREAQIIDYYTIITTFKNASHVNQDLFMQSYAKFISDIINHQCKLELYELLMMYFFSISSYVDDFVYTKEIKSTKKHFKKFKNLFIVNVEKIIKKYEEDLNILKLKILEE